MLFYGGLSPIAALRLFSTSGRDCVAAVPWSYSAAAAMQGHKSFCAAVQTENPPPPTHGLCVPAAVNRLCLAEPRQSAGSSKNSQNLTLGRQFKRKFSTKCNKWKSYNFAILQRKKSKRFLILSGNFCRSDLKTLQLIVTSPPRSWPQRDRNSIDFRWSAIGEIVSQGRREFSD